MPLITLFIAYVDLSDSPVSQQNPLSMWSAWLEGFQSEYDRKIKIHLNLRLYFFNKQTVKRT